MDATAAVDARRSQTLAQATPVATTDAVQTLTVTADFHLSEAGRKALLLAGGELG